MQESKAAVQLRMIDHAFRVAAAKCKCRSAKNPCSSKKFTHHSHSQPALCGHLSFERPKLFPRFTKQYSSALVAAAPPLDDASLLEEISKISEDEDFNDQIGELFLKYFENIKESYQQKCEGCCVGRCP